MQESLWGGLQSWGNLRAATETWHPVSLSVQTRHLADQLTTKWAALQGCSSPECVRIYLTVARKWPLFGAKLFAAQPAQLSSKESALVWIAVNEDGVSILDHNTMVWEGEGWLPGGSSLHSES